MNPMDLVHLGAVFIAAVGATWTLRSKLGDVEAALREHVTEDRERFAAINSKLNERKRK